MLAIERERSAIRSEVGHQSEIVSLLDVVRGQVGETSLEVVDAWSHIRNGWRRHHRSRSTSRYRPWRWNGRRRG